MKKYIFILLILFLFPLSSFAWDDCPFGEVDDPYPGKCNRYIDTNNDQLCDHSQIALEETQTTTNLETGEIYDLITGQELKTKTVDMVAKIYKIDPLAYSQALSKYYNIDIKLGNSFQFLHDNYGVQPNIAKDIANSLKSNTEITTSKSTNSKNKKTYHLLPISLTLILLYIISHILSKKRIINIAQHKKIWNLLLLISFLISGILGILLVIRINFGIAFLSPFNILFWHVEMGIAMAIISIFHIIWHWAYFKVIFKKIK